MSRICANIAYPLVLVQLIQCVQLMWLVQLVQHNQLVQVVQIVQHEQLI